MSRQAIKLDRTYAFPSRFIQLCSQEQKTLAYKSPKIASKNSIPDENEQQFTALFRYMKGQHLAISSSRQRNSASL